MIKYYFSHSLKVIRKNIGFATINTIGLSLAIASAIFIGLFVNEELSVDKFHSNRDSIYRVLQEQIQAGEYYQVAKNPGPLIEVLRNDFPEVTRVSGVLKSPELIIAKDRETFFTEKNIYYVDEEFFHLFDYEIIEGKPSSFLQPNVIMLTQNMAQKYFGDENPIGETLKLDGRSSLTVVGILANNSHKSHIKFDFLISSKYLKGRLPVNRWLSNTLNIYVQLESDVEPEIFNSKIESLVSKNIGDSEWEPRLFLEKLSDIYFSNFYDFGSDSSVHGSKKQVNIAIVIGALILIIAVINFVNLTVSLSEKRVKEIGVKKSLGASRVNLIKQLLAESLIQTLVATMLALTLLQFFKTQMNDILGAEVSVSLNDPLVIISAIGAILIIGLLSGMYPAILLSSKKTSEALKGKQAVTSSGKGILRNFLVVFQFSISIILIICAFIINKQFVFLNSYDLGFNKNSTVYLKIPTGSRNDLQTLMNEVSSVSSVKSLSLSTNIPVNMNYYGHSWDWKVRRKPRKIFRFLLYMWIPDLYLPMI